MPDPVILAPGDAIVQVSATAICGADLFPFHGFTPGFENGTILGHEFTGSVVEVGSDVRRVQVGQRTHQSDHDIDHVQSWIGKASQHVLNERHDLVAVSLL